MRLNTQTDTQPVTSVNTLSTLPAALEPGRGEPVTQPLTAMVVFGLLRQGRGTIVRACAGAFVLAVILAFALPVRFTAMASFIPPGSSNPTSAAALMGQLSSLGGLGLLGNKSQGDLYIGILKSHLIAQSLVQQFDLKKVYGEKKESEAEKVLAKRSNFEAGTKDPIVTINVTDHSPQRAAALVNAYLQALQGTTANLNVSESSQRRQFFEQRLAKEKDDLANAEVALKQSQEKSGLIAPAGQTASEIQTLAQLHAQITDRETRLAALLQDETESNEDVIRLKSEVGSLQSQLGQLENGQAGKPFGGLSAAQMPEAELEFIRRSRDVKYHEALFEIIAKQYEAARLDEARDAPLQILDRGSVPDTRSSPPRLLIMAIGLMMGLLGGAAWVIFRAAGLGAGAGAR